MAASKAQIRAWFHVAEREGATHMLMVCDTYDWEDYPVNCEGEEAARKRYAELHEVNMQRVMEVYKIELGWQAQSEGRVQNW